MTGLVRKAEREHRRYVRSTLRNRARRDVHGYFRLALTLTIILLATVALWLAWLLLRGHL